jgi:hypothetical protein
LSKQKAIKSTRGSPLAWKASSKAAIDGTSQSSD